MNYVTRRLYDLIGYTNNPRDNEEAIQFVCNSVREYGYKVPIVIDNNNVIVTGHTRWEALKRINQEQGLYEEVTCILANDLTEEQIREFRIVDNQVAGIAKWNHTALKIELDSLTNFRLEDFGEIKGYTDVVIAPEVMAEPEMTVSKVMVQVGSYKFEWSESAYVAWLAHVKQHHAMGIEDFIISRLEINEADWTLPEAPPII